MRSRLVLALIVPALVAGTISVPTSADAAAAAPTLRAISPTAGPRAGGNTLTIGGSNLDAVDAVRIGSARAKGLVHVSSTELTVVVPRHDPGRVAVRLVVNGTVADTRSPSYRYVSRPTQLTWSKDQVIDPDVGDVGALSCPTPHFCAARVDGFRATRLVAVATGHRPHALVIKGRAEIGDVACGGPKFCLALGRSGHARFWNGARWSVARKIVPAAVFVVACVPGTRFCVVVAANGTSYVHRGGRWVRAGAIPGRHPDDVGSLSCTSSHFCMAGGTSAAYRFDGTRWHDASRGVRSGSYDDINLSCASPTFCCAFGYYDAFRYDGTRWHAADGGSFLNGTALSCWKEGHCLALDLEGNASVYPNGRWGPLRQVTEPNEEPALACSTDGPCFANGGTDAIITRAPGGRWHRPIHIGPVTGNLSDVSCVSTTWCMAVDANGNALRSNGTSWSTPRHVDGYRPIVAVSCASRSFCVAVSGGIPYYGTLPRGQGWAAVYRNGHWRDPVRVDRHALADVACASAKRCVAVDGAGDAVIWNGQRWSSPSKVGRQLYSVACPTATNCVAVGKRSALFDGHGWRQMANPAGAHFLTDITCPKPAYCVAGGEHGFYIRNRGTWSAPVVKRGFLDYVEVACASAALCIGSQDNEVDVWDYAFAGASSGFLNAELYGPKMSWVAAPMCVAVEIDMVNVGRR